jgi:CheY-like chemotaxis protein
MSEARPWRALVVDDDSAIRELIREILEIEGFTVLEAGNGRAAARLARESGPLDLLVTDILMPDEDGLELIQEIRRLAAAGGPKPRILAISGGGSFAGPDLYLASASHFGADLVLSKPFSDKGLVEALTQLGFNLRPRQS